MDACSLFKHKDHLLKFSLNCTSNLGMTLKEDAFSKYTHNIYVYTYINIISSLYIYKPLIIITNKVYNELISFF